MTDTATRNHGPSTEQKDFIKTAVRKDIQLICQAWPKAVEESLTATYGRQDGSSGSGEVDESREMTFRSQNAEAWVADVKPTLALVLRLADAGKVPGERQWTGSFDPPKLVGTFCAAADDIVDLWPVRVDRLWKRLSRLASIAAKHWPETPRKGEVIDGVKVLDKGNFTEMCTECEGSIGGNATDPLARIDGKPYHRKPCYQTVVQRRARSRARRAM